jgi:hypothetical protein
MIPVGPVVRHEVQGGRAGRANHPQTDPVAMKTHRHLEDGVGASVTQRRTNSKGGRPARKEWTSSADARDSEGDHPALNSAET